MEGIVSNGVVYENAVERLPEKSAVAAREA